MTNSNPQAASAPLPMPGARVTSPSGWRARPGGRREWHEGADLRAAVGTPVLATRPGVVHDALPETARGIRGYGNLVVLWHPQDGVYTAYAHLSEMLVARGDRVEAGAVIAATGVTSGGRHPRMCPHLHFAVRRPRSDGRAPWPGAYPHPERAPWAHRSYWVDPNEYLRGFGLEAATTRGAGELRIRPSSAADAGGGRPYPPRCPRRSAVVLAGAELPPRGAPAERPLTVAHPGRGAAAPDGTASPPTRPGESSCPNERSCWPFAMLVGAAGFTAAALASKGRPR